MVGHDGVDRRGIGALDHPAGQHSTPSRSTQWVREHTVDDILELSTAFRIPNAPVGNGANVTSFDHFVERGAFVTNPRDGFTQPGAPYRIGPVARAPDPKPLRGWVSTPITTAETDIWA